MTQQADAAKAASKVPQPRPAGRNPDVWDPADLITTQHRNALYPHPDSQVAKQMKTQSALRVYERASATNS